MKPAKSQLTNHPKKREKDEIWSVLYRNCINVVNLNIYWVLLCLSSEKWPVDTEDHLKRGLSVSTPPTQVGNRTYLSQPMQQWPTTLCLRRFMGVDKGRNASEVVVTMSLD